MKHCLLIIFCLLSLSSLMGQKETSTLQVLPTFKGESLMLDHAYAFEEDSVVLTKLRFYLSDLSLWLSGKEVWAERKSYHLIDLEEPSSLDLVIKKGAEFDEIRFRLGIDSATNVSGAMGGDLDPTKGMYWSWNTGYVNFKLEGKSPLAGSQNKRFIYHLGGYMPPYASAQAVALPCHPGQEITIEIDIKQFLEAVDLAQKPNIMSPGEQSANLSVKTAALFKIVAHD